jgi:hypothetical protein
MSKAQNIFIEWKCFVCFSMLLIVMNKTDVDDDEMKEWKVKRSKRKQSFRQTEVRNSEQ